MIINVSHIIQIPMIALTAALFIAYFVRKKPLSVAVKVSICAVMVVVFGIGLGIVTRGLVDTRRYFTVYDGGGSSGGNTDSGNGNENNDGGDGDDFESGAVPAVYINNYREIPGITEAEIQAIETLQAQRSMFVFGAACSTEAFYLPDGEYAGFSKELSGFLSEMFAINFSLRLYEWADLLEGLQFGVIDFTVDLTPTAERTQRYDISETLAERGVRLFTRSDTDISFEYELAGFRVGFLSNSSFSEGCFPDTLST